MSAISHPIAAQPEGREFWLNGRRPPPLSWRDRLSRLATKLYSIRVTPVQSSSPPEQPITVVAISDTHNLQPDLPDGDLLLHGGDLTQRGSFEELQAQLDWLKGQKHHYKVIIGGSL